MPTLQRYAQYINAVDSYDTELLLFCCSLAEHLALFSLIQDCLLGAQNARDAKKNEGEKREAFVLEPGSFCTLARTYFDDN